MALHCVCCSVFVLCFYYQEIVAIYGLLMLVVLFYRYLDAIERAVANGDCVLIENMGENMDPVLDPLVGRNTIKKGRCVPLNWIFFISMIQ